MALYESNIPDLELLARGKVRDIYAIDDERLLIVTTDRLSAFDVIMPDAVDNKGAVLTQISNFWFAMMQDIVPNHLTGELPSTVLGTDAFDQRAIVVRRLQPLPIEAVARGYLIGSGWKDYCETGRVCGIELPPGLQQAARLPQPLFTPATKAAVGDHDENIDYARAETILGAELAARVRTITLKIYERAADFALQRGIIIADTKFEFGVDRDGKLFVIDEMLTPDSSRFWPADTYTVGTSPPSFDKQYLRDYLETLDWNKTGARTGVACKNNQWHC